ncbi:hypothetical protein MTMN5_02163 [Marinobacter salarius]|nr:hypothetical protein MTMN5_02163 [Marinobacter salarius]
MLLSGMDNDLLQVVHYFLPALVVGVMAKVSFGAMRSVASMLDRNHRYPLLVQPERQRLVAGCMLRHAVGNDQHGRRGLRRPRQQRNSMVIGAVDETFLQVHVGRFRAGCWRKRESSRKSGLNVRRSRKIRLLWR